MKSLRIVFAGTPEFAAAHLQALLNSQHQVVAVYSQPDRPAGRGKQLQASPVKQLALAQGIEVFQPLHLKDEAQQQLLASHQADLMVVVAYGLLLPQAVLDLFPLGAVNVHGSLLPRWRGAAPIARAIQAGDELTGVGLMQMEKGLDTGPVWLEASLAIGQHTGQSLHDALIPLGQDCLLRGLALIQSGQSQPNKQDDNLACYAHKLNKSESLLDWHKPALELERQIRAFNPVPGSHFELDGQKIKVWQAELVDASGQPGQVLAADASGLLVACGQQSLRLLQLQNPGKGVVQARDWLNGRGSYFNQPRVLA